MKSLLLVKILIVLTSSLSAQVYPRELTVMPGGSTYVLGSGPTKQVGWVIDALAAGSWTKMSLRPTFLQLHGFSTVMPPTIWDVEVTESSNTVDTTSAYSFHLHNLSTAKTLLSRKKISMPAPIPNFPNGGLDILIAENFCYQIIFDTPLVRSYPINSYITINFFSFPGLNLIDAANYNSAWLVDKYGSILSDTVGQLDTAMGVGIRHSPANGYELVMWSDMTNGILNSVMHLFLSVKPITPVSSFSLIGKNCFTRLDLSDYILLINPLTPLAIPVGLENQTLIAQGIITNQAMIGVSPTFVVRAPVPYSSTPGVRTMFYDHIPNSPWQIIPIKLE